MGNATIENSQMYGLSESNPPVKASILGVLYIITLLFAAGYVIGGPVLPNEALVVGVVSEYGIVSSRLHGIQPGQAIYKITIFIESSGDIEGMPNLLRGKEEQEITFYTKERQLPDLFGKKVRANVSYHGDERGGQWWIKDVEVLQ